MQMKARKPKRKSALPESKTYEHVDADALVRPDVGLQPEFKQKRSPAKYQYDPTLDPQLIWAGKAERTAFEVPTLPLFVHERLSTKAILETLKGHKRDKQMELQLFADPQLSITDRLLKAYEHRDKWTNRLILGDSLIVMNSLLHYENLGGQVQMIYVDPPYGVKFGSNFQPFVRKRDVKHNDDGDMTREPEMVKAYRDTWEVGIHSYLAYIRDRLLVARELLSDSGSVFVQIGDENIHTVRSVIDEIFGADNFCGIVVYQKTTFASSALLPQLFGLHHLVRTESCKCEIQTTLRTDLKRANS
jgi:adenine-specific DNA-methyltransferase